MSKHQPFRHSIRLLMGLLLLGTTQCNHGQCEEMRDKLTGLKDAWQTCQKDEDCVVVGGNRKDCTGILSCNFAVNRVNRGEAERTVASLPEETVDCIECSPPTCIGGETARCDNVTGRCSMETSAAIPDASSIGVSNHRADELASAGASLAPR